MNLDPSNFAPNRDLVDAVLSGDSMTIA